MILKGIGATTHIDRHNCRITKEVLEDMAKDITDGVCAVGMGVEHNLAVMPIGKVLNGKIIELEDGEYALEIEQEIFEEYFSYEDERGAKWYITGSKTDRRPFADTQMDNTPNIKISIDPVNFSQEDVEKLMDFYKKECSFDTECLIRKSYIPDPEIMFTLMAGTLAIMTGKKVLDKTAEQVANDVVKIYDMIKKASLETVKRFNKKNRPVTYVIREKSTSVIELIVVTEKVDVLFEALTAEKMDLIEKEIENFKRRFDVNIAKLQCVYAVDEAKWLVNYVSTRDGKVIGSEKCFKNTVELSKRVRSGLSVGIVEK